MPNVHTSNGLMGFSISGTLSVGDTDAFSWIGPTGGSWETASNWQDVTAGLDPAVSVPGAGDPVTIVGSAGPIYVVITGGGTAASLTVTGYAALSGSYSAGALIVGSIQTSSGPLDGGLALGAASELLAGTVAIQYGIVTVSGAGASLAASGTVSIGIPSSLLPGMNSFVESDETPGTLALAGGATLTASSGLAILDGLVSATGSGSAANVTGDVTIGTQFPSDPVVPYTHFNTGSLSVLNGASISASGSVVSDQGPIVVSGAGSSLRVGGTLVIDTSDAIGVALSVASGATILANGLLIQQPYDGVAYPSLPSPTLSVDSTAVLELGSAGGALSGAITVDPGQTLAATTTATILSSIVNNGEIVQSGGALMLTGSIVNSGLISANGGTLTLNGALSGAGMVLIGADASLTMDGSATNGETVTFDGAGATLFVNQTSINNGSLEISALPTIAATLSGFVAGDAIILPGNSLTGASWTEAAGDAGNLTLHNGTSIVATLTLAGNYAGDTFLISPTTFGGSAITPVASGAIVAATVAQALASWSANPDQASFTITDTAMAVQTNLDALQAIVGAINGFALTDGVTPVLSISWRQLTNDAAVLALLPQGYTLIVSGVPIAALSATQANAHVTSFSVTDTGANVVADLAALSTAVADGQLTSISLTDGSTSNLELTVGQLSADGAVLGALAGPYNVTVTDTVAATTDGLDLAGAGAGNGGGEVTVSGSQAPLNNVGRFVVGDAGIGSLSIFSGGTVVTSPGSVAGMEGMVIANLAGAAGSSVDVSGGGSRLTVAGLLDVGDAGSGALQIASGATVSAGSLDAADVAAAVANISVSGAGTAFNVTGSATVADDGTGVMSVLSGATFTAANLTIGEQGASSGALVVSGDGSMVILSGALNIGSALGTGDMTVGPGATVDATVVNLQGDVVLEGGFLDPTVYIENAGSTISGFGTVGADYLVLEGTILSNGTTLNKATEVVLGTVVGGGTLAISGGTTSDGTAVNGPGILQIGTHDTIELTSAVLNAASTTFTDTQTPTGTYTVTNSVIDVVFQDTTGVLRLDDIAGFGGTIATYHAGDSVVITGATLSGLGVSNGDTLTFSDTGSGAGVGGIDRIIFGSEVSAAGFGIVGGSTVEAVACFAEGTLIETDRGPIVVEALRIEDRVIIVDGHGESDAEETVAPATGGRINPPAPRSEPIVWIGERTVRCNLQPRPDTVWPVRVSAGALGTGRPTRDLWLSPDHAVLVAGVLVPVKLLIDGTGITQVRRRTVKYFHVELSRHAVILAEGLPVESYLDTGDRTDFRQTGAAIRLYPDFAARLAPGCALVWEAFGAAPLVLAGEQLATARRAVAEIAANRRFAGPRSTAARLPG